MAEPRFPSDPRYAMMHKIRSDELEALSEDRYLSTGLLDLMLNRAILQRSAVDNEGFLLCTGCTKIEEYLQMRNNKAKRYSTMKKNVDRLRRKMVPFQHGKFSLLFPHVRNSHFFTIRIKVDTNASPVVASTHVF